MILKHTLHPYETKMIGRIAAIIVLFYVYDGIITTTHGWILSPSSTITSSRNCHRLPFRHERSTSSLLMVSNTTTVMEEPQRTIIEYNDFEEDNHEDLMTNNDLNNKEEDKEEDTSSTTMAIFLNVNARGVTSKLVHAFEQEVANSKNIRLYTTKTLEEARMAIEEIASSSKPPKMIVPIGGDGTLCTVLQHYHDCLEGKAKLPMFGYIPMGTGNAVGSVVGTHTSSHRKRRKRDLLFQSSQSKVIHTLQDMIQIAQDMEENGKNNKNNKMVYDIVDLPLLNVTSTTATSSSSYVTFFAGLGFDSLLLQDYQNLQRWTKRNFPASQKTFFSGVWGYCVALFTRTLPKCSNLKRAAHKVKVHVTTSTPSFWIDHRRGDVIRPVEEDTRTLYRGTAGIIAASTVPYYGGGLRAFPFSRLYTDKMQLRIGRIHPLRGVANLPSIFSGSYRDKRPNDFGVLDFVGKDFTVQVLSDAHPLQQAGESVGPCQKVKFELLPSEYSVRFVTLIPPRLVYDDV